MDLKNGYFNLPGRIVEYFAEDQTATIRICAEKIDNTTDGLNTGRRRGLLEDVPVHTPSGGGWSMTMPIKPGDTCIIFFSQVGYDHWLLRDQDVGGSTQGSPNFWLERSFNINDGYALVGLNTIPRAVQSYSAVNSQWRNADATQLISLNEDLSITIISPTSITVNAPEVNVVAPLVNVTSEAVNIDSTVSAFTGNVTIGGTLTVTTGVTAAGIAFNTHVHPPGTVPPANPAPPPAP